MVPRVRVLTVARWYPAHDDPGRGSFVADLVEALTAASTEVRVASWEFAHYTPGTPPGALDEARRAWSAAVALDDATNVPRSWGAGVPVARVPDLYIAGETVSQRIDGHAALLVPFGVALHERWPFDVIHAHTAVPDGAAAIQLARTVGVPVMVTEHDSTLRQRLAQNADERAAYRGVIDAAARLGAVSHRFRDLLRESLGPDADGIEVFPNPIPDVFFDGAFDGERRADELLYVGARKEDKGTDTLLRAFALAHGRKPALRLRLVGRSRSESDESRWKALADDLLIASAVSFEPPLSRSDVAKAMLGAGVFVHPSPFESFGVVVVEALASGLPIAATRSGVEEIVGTDGRHGEIADGTDAESLAAAIIRVIDRRSRYVAADLRASVLRYQASRVARETLARYEAIIGSHARADGSRSRRVVSEPVARAPAVEPHGTETLGRVLVVGQNSVRAERRVATLAPALRERVTLLTRRPGAGLLASDRGDVIDIDPQAAYDEMLAAAGSPGARRWSGAERIRRFVRDPRRAFERRRLRQHRDELMAELLGSQVLDVWRRIAADAATSDPVLVALDIEDVTVAERAIQHGARLAPGGTRWLADRWDARKSAEDAAE
jgi:glycosyltransferase involved in cell wall biosynthesis